MPGGTPNVAQTFFDERHLFKLRLFDTREKLSKLLKRLANGFFPLAATQRHVSR